MRRRHSSSRCTNCCSTVALRPPNSGGWAGSSQPLSNSNRCHLRAHCGMCDTERRALQRLGFRRQVLVEERRELGAKLLDVGIKSQLH